MEEIKHKDLRVEFLKFHSKLPYRSDVKYPDIEISNWWIEKLDLAVSKERERRDAQIIEFINSGEPAPWNDTGWSVELSDVEKFIKNTK